MIFPNQPQTTGHVARHYDDLDAFYREIWGDHVHHGLWVTGRESMQEALEALVDRVAREGRIGPGTRVCDVGCGYGATARRLVTTRGAEVVGLTISERQYAHGVSAAGGAGPTLLLRDWLENGFADEAFDAVIAIESLAHMPDKRRFFGEAARTLRPGGRLVICPWLAAENPRPWQVRWLLEPICREGRVPSLGSSREYTAMMEEEGIRAVLVEDWSRLVRRTWTLVAARFAWMSVRYPRYLAHLLDPDFPERIFAVAVLRMIVAFRTGAFRYGILVGEKSSGATSGDDVWPRGAPAASGA